jgi:hypothetical protein
MALRYKSCWNVFAAGTHACHARAHVMGVCDVCMFVYDVCDLGLPNTLYPKTRQPPTAKPPINTPCCHFRPQQRAARPRVLGRRQPGQRLAAGGGAHRQGGRGGVG